MDSIHSRSVAAILVLVMAILACSSPSDLLPTQTPYATYTPFPTLTPFPTATLIPSPTATPENVVLLDLSDLSDSSMCLPESSDGPIKNAIETDGYHMSLSQAHWFSWAYCPDKRYDDVIIEVDAQKLGGARENDFGIGFRYNEEDQLFYSFTVDSNGYYGLGLVNEKDASKNFYLLIGGPIQGIRGSQANHLKVVAKGDLIQLYVNDQLIGLVHDKTLFSGQVGLIIGTFEKSTSEILFNNFKVSEPAQ